MIFLRARITTGNRELDAMLEGGIPEGNHVLLAGGPGVGKTLACFEFLYKNALNGVNGLFISLEEKADAIIGNSKDAFPDFDKIDKFLKEKKIIIYEQDLEEAIAESESKGERRYEFSKLMADVVSAIQKTKAKCVAVDSVSIFRLFLKDPLEYRVLMVSLLTVLKNNGATSLSTIELQDRIAEPPEFFPEFFLYDGLILFHSPVGTNSTVQSLQIVKMRGTDHSFQNVPYRITNKGIKILNTSAGSQG